MVKGQTWHVSLADWDQHWADPIRRIRDKSDNAGCISLCRHESNSYILPRCQTWRMFYRFNSLILLWEEQEAGWKKGAFVMLIKKQKVKDENDDGQKWQVCDIREHILGDVWWNSLSRMWEKETSMAGNRCERLAHWDGVRVKNESDFVLFDSRWGLICADSPGNWSASGNIIAILFDITAILKAPSWTDTFSNILSLSQQHSV